MIRSLFKVCSVLTTLVFFATNVAFAYSIERSIWSERKIPSAPKALNPIQSIADSMSKPIIQDAAGISLSHARINEIFEGHNPDIERVIVIQDIHMNEEAQTNIAHLIQNLIDTKQVDLVALEGAFENLDFSLLRSEPNQIVREDVARYFLIKNKIGGPSYVGITSVEPLPRFVGVDDLESYKANVDAYLNSVELRVSNEETLLNVQAANIQAKTQNLNSKLKVFDQLVAQHDRNEIGLGEFLERLDSGFRQNDGVGGQNDGRVRHPGMSLVQDPVIDKFLKAYRIEKNLNLKKINQERKQALGELSKKISKKHLSDLTVQAAAHQSGKIQFGQFYQYVSRLFTEYNLNLSKFPVFAEYIEYVILSDGIKPVELMAKVDQIKADMYEQLISNDIEREIIQESQMIELEKKLINFELTPREWEEYTGIRASVHPGAREHDVRKNLDSFEEFYHQAEIRSQKMVQNILDQKAKRVVFVTGGFHSPEVVHLLKEKNISYVLAQPKITKIDHDNGTSYLSVFQQEKTSLENLFAGERLFVTPASTVAGSRFGMTRLVSVVISISARAVSGITTSFTANGRQYSTSPSRGSIVELSIPLRQLQRPVQIYSWDIPIWKLIFATIALPVVIVMMGSNPAGASVSAAPLVAGIFQMFFGKNKKNTKRTQKKDRRLRVENLENRILMAVDTVPQVEIEEDFSRVEVVEPVEPMVIVGSPDYGASVLAVDQRGFEGNPQAQDAVLENMFLNDPVEEVAERFALFTVESGESEVPLAMAAMEEPPTPEEIAEDLSNQGGLISNEIVNKSRQGIPIGSEMEFVAVGNLTGLDQGGPDLYFQIQVTVFDGTSDDVPDDNFFFFDSLSEPEPGVSEPEILAQYKSNYINVQQFYDNPDDRFASLQFAFPDLSQLNLDPNQEIFVGVGMQTVEILPDATEKRFQPVPDPQGTLFFAFDANELPLNPDFTLDVITLSPILDDEDNVVENTVATAVPENTPADAVFSVYADVPENGFIQYVIDTTLDGEEVIFVSDKLPESSLLEPDVFALDPLLVARGYEIEGIGAVSFDADGNRADFTGGVAVFAEVFDPNNAPPVTVMVDNQLLTNAEIDGIQRPDVRAGVIAEGTDMVTVNVEVEEGQLFSIVQTQTQTGVDVDGNEIEFEAIIAATPWTQDLTDSYVVQIEEGATGLGVQVIQANLDGSVEVGEFKEGSVTSFRISNEAVPTLDSNMRALSPQEPGSPIMVGQFTSEAVRVHIPLRPGADVTNNILIAGGSKADGTREPAARLTAVDFLNGHVIGGTSETTGFGVSLLDVNTLEALLINPFIPIFVSHAGVGEITEENRIVFFEPNAQRGPNNEILTDGDGNVIIDPFQSSVIIPTGLNPNAAIVYENIPGLDSVQYTVDQGNDNFRVSDRIPVGSDRNVVDLNPNDVGLGITAFDNNGDAISLAGNNLFVEFTDQVPNVMVDRNLLNPADIDDILRSDVRAGGLIDGIDVITLEVNAQNGHLFSVIQTQTQTGTDADGNEVEFEAIIAATPWTEDTLDSYVIDIVEGATGIGVQVIQPNADGTVDVGEFKNGSATSYKVTNDAIPTLDSTMRALSPQAPGSNIMVGAFSGEAIRVHVPLMAGTDIANNLLIAGGSRADETREAAARLTSVDFLNGNVIGTTAQTAGFGISFLAGNTLDALPINPFIPILVSNAGVGEITEDNTIAFFALNAERGPNGEILTDQDGNVIVNPLQASVIIPEGMNPASSVVYNNLDDFISVQYTVDQGDDTFRISNEIPQGPERDVVGLNPGDFALGLSARDQNLDPINLSNQNMLVEFTNQVPNVMVDGYLLNTADIEDRLREDVRAGVIPVGAETIQLNLDIKEGHFFSVIQTKTETGTDVDGNEIEFEAIVQATGWTLQTDEEVTLDIHPDATGIGVQVIQINPDGTVLKGEFEDDSITFFQIANDELPTIESNYTALTPQAPGSPIMVGAVTSPAVRMHIPLQPGTDIDQLLLLAVQSDANEQRQLSSRIRENHFFEGNVIVVEQLTTGLGLTLVHPESLNNLPIHPDIPILVTSADTNEATETNSISFMEPNAERGPDGEILRDGEGNVITNPFQSSVVIPDGLNPDSAIVYQNIPVLESVQYTVDLGNNTFRISDLIPEDGVLDVVDLNSGDQGLGLAAFDENGNTISLSGQNIIVEFTDQVPNVAVDRTLLNPAEINDILRSDVRAGGLIDDIDVITLEVNAQDGHLFSVIQTQTQTGLDADGNEVEFEAIIAATPWTEDTQDSYVIDIIEGATGIGIQVIQSNADGTVDVGEFKNGSATSYKVTNDAVPTLQSTARALNPIAADSPILGAEFPGGIDTVRLQLAYPKGVNLDQAILLLTQTDKDENVVAVEVVTGPKEAFLNGYVATKKNDDVVGIGAQLLDPETGQLTDVGFSEFIPSLFTPADPSDVNTEFNSILLTPIQALNADGTPAVDGNGDPILNEAVLGTTFAPGSKSARIVVLGASNDFFRISITEQLESGEFVLRFISDEFLPSNGVVTQFNVNVPDSLNTTEVTVGLGIERFVKNGDEFISTPFNQIVVGSPAANSTQDGVQLDDVFDHFSIPELISPEIDQTPISELIERGRPNGFYGLDARIIGPIHGWFSGSSLVPSNIKALVISPPAAESILASNNGVGSVGGGPSIWVDPLTTFGAESELTLFFLPIEYFLTSNVNPNEIQSNAFVVKVDPVISQYHQNVATIKIPSENPDLSKVQIFVKTSDGRTLGKEFGVESGAIEFNLDQQSEYLVVVGLDQDGNRITYDVPFEAAIRHMPIAPIGLGEFSTETLEDAVQFQTVMQPAVIDDTVRTDNRVAALVGNEEVVTINIDVEDGHLFSVIQTQTQTGLDADGNEVEFEAIIAATPWTEDTLDSYVVDIVDGATGIGIQVIEVNADGVDVGEFKNGSITSYKVTNDALPTLDSNMRALSPQGPGSEIMVGTFSGDAIRVHIPLAVGSDITNNILIAGGSRSDQSRESAARITAVDFLNGNVIGTTAQTAGFGISFLAGDTLDALPIHPLVPIFFSNAGIGEITEEKTIVFFEQNAVRGPDGEILRDKDGNVITDPTQYSLAIPEDQRGKSSATFFEYNPAVENYQYFADRGNNTIDVSELNPNENDPHRIALDQEILGLGVRGLNANGVAVELSNNMFVQFTNEQPQILIDNRVLNPAEVDEVLRGDIRAGGLIDGVDVITVDVNAQDGHFFSVIFTETQTGIDANGNEVEFEAIIAATPWTEDTAQSYVIDVPENATGIGVQVIQPNADGTVDVGRFSAGAITTYKITNDETPTLSPTARALSPIAADSPIVGGAFPAGVDVARLQLVYPEGVNLNEAILILTQTDSNGNVIAVEVVQGPSEAFLEGYVAQRKNNDVTNIGAQLLVPQTGQLMDLGFSGLIPLFVVPATESDINTKFNSVLLTPILALDDEGNPVDENTPVLNEAILSMTFEPGAKSARVLVLGAPTDKFKITITSQEPETGNFILRFESEELISSQGLVTEINVTLPEAEGLDTNEFTVGLGIERYAINGDGEYVSTPFDFDLPQIVIGTNETESLPDSISLVEVAGTGIELFFIPIETNITSPPLGSGRVQGGIGAGGTGIGAGGFEQGGQQFAGRFRIDANVVLWVDPLENYDEDDTTGPRDMRLGRHNTYHPKVETGAIEEIDEFFEIEIEKIPGDGNYVGFILEAVVEEELDGIIYITMEDGTEKEIHFVYVEGQPIIIEVPENAKSILVVVKNKEGKEVPTRIILSRSTSQELLEEKLINEAQKSDGEIEEEKLQEEIEELLGEEEVQTAAMGPGVSALLLFAMVTPDVKDRMEKLRVFLLALIYEVVERLKKKQLDYRQKNKAMATELGLQLPDSIFGMDDPLEKPKMDPAKLRNRLLLLKMLGVNGEPAQYDNRGRRVADGVNVVHDENGKRVKGYAIDTMPLVHILKRIEKEDPARVQFALELMAQIELDQLRNDPANSEYSLGQLRDRTDHYVLSNTLEFLKEQTDETEAPIQEEPEDNEPPTINDPKLKTLLDSIPAKSVGVSTVGEVLKPSTQIHPLKRRAYIPKGETEDEILLELRTLFRDIPEEDRTQYHVLLSAKINKVKLMVRMDRPGIEYSQIGDYQTVDDLKPLYRDAATLEFIVQRDASIPPLFLNLLQELKLSEVGNIISLHVLIGLTLESVAIEIMAIENINTDFKLQQLLDSQA